MDTLRNIILDEGGGFRQLLRIITVALAGAGAGVRDNITKYAFVLYIIILLKNLYCSAVGASNIPIVSIAKAKTKERKSQ